MEHTVHILLYFLFSLFFTSLSFYSFTLLLYHSPFIYLSVSLCLSIFIISLLLLLLLSPVLRLSPRTQSIQAPLRTALAAKRPPPTCTARSALAATAAAALQAPAPALAPGCRVWPHPARRASSGPSAQGTSLLA